MSEDKWEQLRQIVREECERIEARLQAQISTTKKTPKIECVNGRWVGVTAEQVSAWTDAYPAVDVESELKKMAAWIVSNPMLAPKTQIGRFVNSWLTKTQNHASLRSIPTAPRPTETKMKLCAYCDVSASGQVGGIWACNAHWDKAMSRDPVPRMRGVEAKPVAGA